jgi:eukaryotic-like serine/threonine-protein kinase
MTGQTISHYRILEKLGGGGMGVVYKARDLRLDRDVALKFLPAEITQDPKAKERFAQEAKAASSIDHPYICTVYDVEEAEDGRMFIAMACYEGETLKRKIERGSIDPAQALAWAAQVAHGLSEAHERGIVHRDIKPANIFITRNNTVKILDFGLAKLDGSLDITKSGSRLGTTAYMAPEQVRAEHVDHRADIWSLGIVLYEMLAGKAPFGGDNEAAVMYSIVTDELPSLHAAHPAVAKEIERVIKHATSKKAADRYQSMRDVAGDLETLRDPSGNSGSTIAEATFALRTRIRITRMLALFGFLVLLLAGAYYILQPLLSDEAFASHPESVLTISFENLTGDSTLDYLQRAIPVQLETRLEQSRYLEVVTQERTRDIIRNMGRGSPRYVNAELGTEICLKEGIRFLITGSFARAGDLFVSSMKVIDPATKKVLRSADARGKGIESLLASQIDELGKAAERGIGLSQSKIDENNLPVAQLTTESPQALDWYLKGKEAESDYRWDEAVKCYQISVTHDSSFAAAYWSLFYCGYKGDNPTTAFEALKKANEWQWRASDKVRLLIEADYAGYIEENRKKRFDILQWIIKRFPKEREAYESLFYVYVANKDRANKEAMLRKIVTLDPTNEFALNELVNYAKDSTEAFSYLARIVESHPKNTNALDTWGMEYFMLGMYDNALAKLAELARRAPPQGSDWSSAYIIACKEDYDGALAALPAENRLSRGFLEYLRGRPEEAVAHLQRAYSSNETRELVDVAGLMSGWISLEMHQLSKARRSFEIFADSAERHLALSKIRYDRTINPFYQISLGYLELMSGNIEGAKSFLQPLTTDFAGKYRMRIAHVAARFLRGEILLTEGKPQAALDSTAGIIYGLDGNISYETHMIPYNIPLSFRDLRARAWLKLGRVDSAMTEYEYIMSTRAGGGRVHIISPVFHLRLGALYEQKGELEKARNQYQILMRIWNKADATLPGLSEVRTRLAKLKK